MMKLEMQSSATAHWSRRQYESLFSAPANSGQSERFAWIVENESAERPEKAVGEVCDVLAFLVAHRIDAEWELENLVVAQPFRRLGIGTLLLQELIAQVRAKSGKSILLEVRSSNHGARSLYQKAGFEEVGLRKSYYQDPCEDAILYRFSLEFS